MKNSKKNENMSREAGSASGGKKLLVLIILCLFLNACQAQPQAELNTNTNSVAKKPVDITNDNEKLGLEDLLGQYNGAIVKTNLGDIKVKFYNEGSPLTVNNFLNLAKKGFYDGTKFHRVIKDFMIQGGDPNSKDDNWADDGTGGPNYKFKDEINTHLLVRGSLAMANSGKNTNGSQFFIVTKEATPWLDGLHTNFGQVIDGLIIIDKIEASETNENDHPLEDIIINSIELIKIE